MKRNTVWVLWARTWISGGGEVFLPKVTSKKVYQAFVAKMHYAMAAAERAGHKTSERLPTYFQESHDKAALEKMMELAYPLTKYEPH